MLVHSLLISATDRLAADKTNPRRQTPVRWTSGRSSVFCLLSVTHINRCGKTCGRIGIQSAVVNRTQFEGKVVLCTSRRHKGECSLMCSHSESWKLMDESSASRPGRFNLETKPRFLLNSWLAGRQRRYGCLWEQKMPCPCPNTDPGSFRLKPSLYTWQTSRRTKRYRYLGQLFFWSR